MSDRKPILCLDFDGVLHSYTSGWKGADVIPDPPVEGALTFLLRATKQFDVCVFSSRSHQPGGIQAMLIWLRNAFMDDLQFSRVEAEDVVGMISFPTEKPPALITIDDRAITFTGEWPDVDALLAFKPWNKRD